MSEKKMKAPKIENQPEPEAPYLILTTGDLIEITENDMKRLDQRLTQGGAVEGAQRLDSGSIVVLQNIAIVR